MKLAFHSNHQHFVCKSKVKYTNLKSVERALAILPKAYGEEMTYYQCGTSKHYHLTHTSPAERRGRGNQLRKDTHESERKSK